MKAVNEGTPAQRVERGSEGGKRECWQESQAEYGLMPAEETVWACQVGRGVQGPKN